MDDGWRMNPIGPDSEIYVRPFPNVDSGGWQVSSDGGTRPVWAQNRRELFYLIAGPGGGRSRMMSVPVQTSGSFAHGQASMLFEGQFFVGTAFSRYFDVSPDGQRFLMIKTSASPGAETMSGVVVVLNWFEELKQRVPIK
jgi:hypothetical protein